MKEPYLNIKVEKYTQYSNFGTCFNLNKATFHWKELKNFDKLENSLKNRRYQNYFSQLEKYRKPTFLRTPTVENYPIDGKNIVTMAVCLPCYDEEWSELSGTLRSLSKNILVHRKRPDNTFELHVTVFIIQDGWNKVTKSVKDGIVREWGCPTDQWITNSLKRSEEGISIIIPNGEIYYPSYNTSLTDVQTGVCMYPIFITKTMNFQKFNSHLLFFSLCHLQKPDCVFLTDCGTLYNSDCIYRLVEYLVRKHSTVIGVTARQSVMSETERSEITEYPYWVTNKKRSSGIVRFFKHIYWWLSPAPLQGFEFESTFLLSTAMFNLLGALAVLPGPCQLIWWKHLENNDKTGCGVLDLYFKHLSMNINTSGIIKTNTLLAEDRVLSFAMVLRTHNLKTIWVKGAVFSYEPMLTWVKLLGQRRRWINGTLATYLYYIYHNKGIDELIMSGLANNYSLLVLWHLQVYQSFLQILSPSFFSIALYESIIYTTKKYPVLLTYLNRISVLNLDSSIIATSLYFLFYIVCLSVSFSLGKKTKWILCYECIMESVYVVFSLVNMSVSVFILYNILTTAQGGIVFYILLGVWLVPFILSLFVSVSSSFYYLLYTIPFLSQISQYVSFIPTYSFARLHDLSWGNRDSTAIIDNKTYINFMCITLQLNFLSIILNGGIITLYVYLYLKLGHQYYIYIPLFCILFLSLIIQVGFACIYILKTVCKDLYKQMFKNNKEYRQSENMSVFTGFSTKADSHTANI